MAAHVGGQRMSCAPMSLTRSFAAASRTRRFVARYSSSAPSSVEDYDVVVVGGGPIGLAFASALSTCYG